MTPACELRELKNLIEIRDLFSSQLTNKKIGKESKKQIEQIVETCRKRICLILDTMILEDDESRRKNALKLQESRSSWFNDLSQSILKMLVAKEISEHIDVSRIFSEIFSLF